MGNHRARKGAFGAGAIIALAVAAFASVAYACTILPQVSYSLLPESAAPGSPVEVKGTNVRGDGPVEVRWNGVKGELLGVGTPVGGVFSVPVKLPKASPGIYSLMLVAADGSVARTSLEVIGGSADAVSTPVVKLWPSSSTTSLASDGSGSDASLVGMSLLAVGLVGLFAGSTMAVVRRRRVAVEVGR